MRDIDALIAGIEGPAPPAEPPRIRRRRPGPWLAVAGLALVAGALLVVGGPAGPRFRGSAAERVQVDLRMSVDRGGVAVRLAPDHEVHTGDRVFFRVTASRETTVAVWVEAPGGLTPIALVEAGPEPTDVGRDGGLVAWRFDGPGRYVFRASHEGMGVCDDCPTIPLVTH